MNLFCAREDYVREIVALVQFVLARLRYTALFLVEELIHAVVTSRCARLVAEQGVRREVYRPDLVLQHAEALMGTTQIRTIITCQLLMLLFFN